MTSDERAEFTERLQRAAQLTYNAGAYVMRARVEIDGELDAQLRDLTKALDAIGDKLNEIAKAAN